MDTGWLLVGAAGVSGGLALVLIGAGMAASPLLLPVGLVLAFVAYLAWVAGSSRVVATVYAEVGDPEGRADRTGRRQDRVDPDGHWGTAADGGHEPGAGATTGRGTGVGPDGREVWDAGERDRVGGWDDWDWEWADRRWREFEREYADTGRDGARTRRDRRDATGGTRDGRRGGGTRSRGRQQARQRARTRGSDGRRRPGDHRRARARELLGVDPDADAETVRRAYRERVKETHPDRGGDPEAFKRVQWAYEYLTDSE